MHYVFEIYDFKNNNINELNITEKSKEKLTNFLNHQEFANIKDATIYKEHEIVFKEDSKIYHGIIDLLLKYSDHFDIIDYKLSNIASPHYLEQLKGYKKYILKKYKLPVNIYLYSIEQDILKKIVD
jgi:ATP-dependent helicase/nuclease subunit A